MIKRKVGEPHIGILTRLIKNGPVHLLSGFHQTPKPDRGFPEPYGYENFWVQDLVTHRLATLSNRRINGRLTGNKTLTITKAGREYVQAKYDELSIVPYRGRTIDFDRPVRVYRKLLRYPRTSRRYSIMQDGLVRGYAWNLAMGKSCKFIILKGGRNRAIKTGIKNVHAFVEGTISTRGVMGTSPDGKLPAIINYTPQKGFTCSNLCMDEFEVKGAMGVLLNQHGMTAAYIH